MSNLFSGTSSTSHRATCDKKAALCLRCGQFSVPINTSDGQSDKEIRSCFERERNLRERRARSVSWQKTPRRCCGSLPARQPFWAALLGCCWSGPGCPPSKSNLPDTNLASNKKQGCPRNVPGQFALSNPLFTGYEDSSPPLLYFY